MPAAIAGIITNGWNPSAFEEVPAAYITYNNYSAAVALNAYIDAPFMLLTPQDSDHASTKAPYDVIYFDGTTFNWIKRGSEGGGTATVIESNILTQYTFTSNGLQNGKYFILT